jgi:hypothetical protein
MNWNWWKNGSGRGLVEELSHYLPTDTEEHLPKKSVECFF